MDLSLCTRKSTFNFILIFFLFFSVIQHGHAQGAPFNKGVNLTNWFQVSNARQIQFTKYTRDDFLKIKSLGFDVIRLPVNLHHMTYGAPEYLLDTLFLELIDQVVNWAEELELHLIIDNHTFSPDIETDPGIGSILNPVWRQLTEHYANRSDYVYYEILNEPHGISDELWNNIQKSVVDEIRKYDTTHYIVIGPAGWNSYHNLSAMPLYEDDRLIYTFHFYDPFLFTHQGASWVTPSMIEVENIPFPYVMDQMPAQPAGLEGTWIASLFDNYWNDGTVSKVEELIDMAVQFRNQRGAPIFCGEFGVYQPNSKEEHRVSWYEVVREYLELNQIAWTMWDYHGGFGLFEENGYGLFDHDLNTPLLEALGMNIPEQTDFIMNPDSVGFILYDDFLQQSIYEASYTDGLLDYFSTDDPNNGTYCVHWTGASQYSPIVFDLRPNRDLSQLEERDFALDLMVKGSDAEISFDVRFIDSKTSSSLDLPWRMGITIDKNMVTFDGTWKHLHIPLKALQEKGAWYEEWYNPRGEYDWSDVDKFEIVPEAKALGSSHLYFDNIHITDLDTAQVYQDTANGSVSFKQQLTNNAIKVNTYPNPCPGELNLTNDNPEILRYSLWDLNGREVQNGHFYMDGKLDLASLFDGIYILQFNNIEGEQARTKIILQKE